ncbi:hypothetical protein RJ640_000841 [Escallonia rubra]|uniref:Pre-mRNA-splicing factor 38 n=1 Tax=Escallonia rubra TaxID=112253 RepID=A0AA88R0W5_9ASTE|nr:hypothetical protein RJ640_000841 [Escallonia rubra]
MAIPIKPIEQLLEKVLCMNILSSDYFKELYRLKTFHDVIDEIYNQVDHVEPWMTGNCRGPSTAFCLLYKFFTMKLTVKQMHGLLQHQDSPYIRAIGFLYLRYAADAKTLWGWFEPYIKDEETTDEPNKVGHDKNRTAEDLKGLERVTILSSFNVACF